MCLITSKYRVGQIIVSRISYMGLIRFLILGVDYYEKQAIVALFEKDSVSVSEDDCVKITRYSFEVLDDNFYIE